MTRAEKQAIARVLTFGLPAAGCMTLWLNWHQPGHLAGLGIAAVTGILAGPVLLVTLAYILPGMLLGLLSSDWLRWWRKPHWWRRHKAKRKHIPAWLARAALAASGYRCVVCHSRAHLEVDHVFAWSLGGINSLWNLTALCYECNMYKSNYWQYRSGMIVYRAWPEFDDPDIAREILHIQLRHRWNPARLWRAAWELTA